MCKLLIVLVIGMLCSGCASSTLSHSSKVSSSIQKSYQTISKAKPLKGCRALKNGYLVCPKMARR